MLDMKEGAQGRLPAVLVLEKFRTFNIFLLQISVYHLLTDLLGLEISKWGLVLQGINFFREVYAIQVKDKCWFCN